MLFIANNLFPIWSFVSKFQETNSQQSQRKIVQLRFRPYVFSLIYFPMEHTAFINQWEDSKHNSLSLFGATGGRNLSHRIHRTVWNEISNLPNLFFMSWGKETGENK